MAAHSAEKVVDISKILDPPVNFFKRIFKLVDTFFDEEPWTVLSYRDTVQIEALGESYVMRINIERWEEDMNILLFTNFEDCMGFAKHGMSEQKVFTSGKAFSCSLMKQFQLPTNIKSFIKKHGLPQTGINMYPVFRNLYGRNNLSKMEFQFFEIVLAVIPRFVKTFVPKGPYDYDSRMQSEVVSLASGEKTLVTLTYPAGYMSPYDEKPDVLGQSKCWKTMVGINGISKRISPYLTSKGEVVEAMRADCQTLALPSDSYLKKMSTKDLKAHLVKCRVSITGCLDRSDLLAAAHVERQACTDEDDMENVHDLAFALMTLMVEEASLEAISIAKTVPQQAYVAAFLMRCYLDMCMYEDAVKMMKYYGNSSCMWAWTTALLEFKKKGGTARTSKAALRNAVHSNCIVVMLMIKMQKLLPIEDIKLQPNNDPMKEHIEHASLYVYHFVHDWLRTKGAVKWICTTGVHYMEEFKTLLHTEGFDGETLRPTVMIPQVILSCHFCKKGKGITIQKCARCKSVGYCSKECQTKDWKNHKKEC